MTLLMDTITGTELGPLNAIPLYQTITILNPSNVIELFIFYD